jgi:hypothetical protein
MEQRLKQHHNTRYLPVTSLSITAAFKPRTRVTGWKSNEGIKRERLLRERYETNEEECLVANASSD